MPILYMDGKEFLDKFVQKESPKKILNCQYVLVSTTLKKSGKYGKQAILVTHLFPNSRIITDYLSTQDRKAFKREYREQLRENEPFFAALIKGVLKDELATVVFLCGNDEHKHYKHLTQIAKFVEKRFGYKMLTYKEYRSGEHQDVDNSSVYQAVQKTLKTAKKQKKKQQLSTVEGRQKLVDKMSKEEMKNFLKKRNLYRKGMTKREMKDSLEVFFVNE